MVEQFSKADESLFSMPFFSVVIPLYNKAPYIGRSLESVLGQSFNDFELIVIDDGSTDEGATIVALYRDPRIRLIYQENSGECAARNRGIMEAKAEWLAFLDADDEYLPNFLEKMHDAITKHPDIGFAFSNILYTGPSGITIKMIKSKYSYFQVIDNYCDFLCDHSLGGATSSSIAVRKAVLQHAGCFPVGILRGGDIDTWIRLGWIAKGGYEPSCLAHYHNEVPGPSWILSEESPRKRLYPQGQGILISSYNNFKQNGIFPERMKNSWRCCLTGYSLGHVRELIQYGDKKAAWRFYLKEMQLDGWWKERLKILIMLLLPKVGILRLRKLKKRIGPD